MIDTCDSESQNNEPSPTKLDYPTIVHYSNNYDLLMIDKLLNHQINQISSSKRLQFHRLYS